MPCWVFLETNKNHVCIHSFLLCASIPFLMKHLQSRCFGTFWSLHCLHPCLLACSLRIPILFGTLILTLSHPHIIGIKRVHAWDKTEEAGRKTAQWHSWRSDTPQVTYNLLSCLTPGRVLRLWLMGICNIEISKKVKMFLKLQLMLPYFLHVLHSKFVLMQRKWYPFTAKQEVFTNLKHILW